VLASNDGRHGFSETYEEHQAKIEQAKADGVLP
jgi:cell division protein YceG involved in septum cleavage